MAKFSKKTIIASAAVLLMVVVATFVYLQNTSKAHLIGAIDSSATSFDFYFAGSIPKETLPAAESADVTKKDCRTKNFKDCITVKSSSGGAKYHFLQIAVRKNAKLSSGANIDTSKVPTWASLLAGMKEINSKKESYFTYLDGGKNNIYLAVVESFTAVDPSTVKVVARQQLSQWYIWEKASDKYKVRYECTIKRPSLEAEAPAQSIYDVNCVTTKDGAVQSKGFNLSANLESKATVWPAYTGGGTDNPTPTPTPTASPSASPSPSSSPTASPTPTPTPAPETVSQLQAITVSSSSSETQKIAAIAKLETYALNTATNASADRTAAINALTNLLTLDVPTTVRKAAFDSLKLALLTDEN